MKIITYEIHSKKELLQAIKSTHLKGDESIHPFAESDIKIQQTSYDKLFPTQRFVLQSQLQNIETLYKQFLKRGINISELAGFISYKTDQSDNTHILTPPIVEIIENQPIIIDGQHRVTFFGSHNIKFNSIFINNIPQEYYPYQLPNQNGWADVSFFEKEIPEGFVRKGLRYNDKSQKQYMFREYNFPGIIKIARRHSGTQY